MSNAALLCLHAPCLHTQTREGLEDKTNFDGERRISAQPCGRWHNPCISKDGLKWAHTDSPLYRNNCKVTLMLRGYIEVWSYCFCNKDYTFLWRWAELYGLSSSYDKKKKKSHRPTATLDLTMYGQFSVVHLRLLPLMAEGQKTQQNTAAAEAGP